MVLGSRAKSLLLPRRPLPLCCCLAHTNESLTLHTHLHRPHRLALHPSTPLRSHTRRFEVRYSHICRDVIHPNELELKEHVFVDGKWCAVLASTVLIYL